MPVIVAHEHWSSRTRREIWVDRLVYRLGDCTIVPSEASKRTVMALEGLPARALQVVYNGVDTSRFTPCDSGAAVRQDGTTLVIAFGR